jgi:hypothetical protein
MYLDVSDAFQAVTKETLVKGKGRSAAPGIERLVDNIA